MREVSRGSEQTLLGSIEKRLYQQFPDVSPLLVDDVVRRERARFDTSLIRDFIPLLVEKSARRQLISTAYHR